VILNLRKENKKLTVEVEKTSKTNINLENIYTEADSKLNMLIDENMVLRRERNDLEAQSRKGMRMVEETEILLANAQEKIKSNDDRTQIDTKKMKDYIDRL